LNGANDNTTVQRKIDEVRARTLAAEKEIRKAFDTHSNKLSKVARNKRARDMKGYEESAFAIARREIVEEAEIMATGGDERGRESGAVKKRKASSGEGDVGGKGAGDANADVATAPPLVETASVEKDKEEEEDKETTVIETLITENANKVEEKTEEHRNDKETEEEEFFEPSLVLKTDSGTELDIKNFQSSADVAPEQRRYLTFLQKHLSVILGVGSRSSD
jgi:signal transduction protein with GAF and PtsI domain